MTREFFPAHKHLDHHKICYRLSPSWLKFQENLFQNGERFSRKVFVGGLPPDIDEGQQCFWKPLFWSSSFVYFFVLHRESHYAVKSHGIDVCWHLSLLTITPHFYIWGERNTMYDMFPWPRSKAFSCRRDHCFLQTFWTPGCGLAA